MAINANGKYPQWAVVLLCGLVAFLGQYVFVLLTSKTAQTEFVTFELRNKIDVQRSDFEGHRRQVEQALTAMQATMQAMYADINKKLDRMEARQEETQKLLMNRSPPGPR